MTGQNTIYVYGDSIMKATAPDENMRYHFHIGEYLEKFAKLPVKIVNRAKFGAYAEKGLAILNSDIEKGMKCDAALIEYGGNDCNFNWAEIAENPGGHHDPKTLLDSFIGYMRTMIEKLRANNVKPVIMTLPPIDPQRYFKYITRNGINGDNILKWLGDVNTIYRYQEMYSNAALKLANDLDVMCIDMRSFILPNRDFSKLISEDGIHPSLAGYELIFGKLYEVLQNSLRDEKLTA